VARYDKYEPKVGGFRAPLAADWPLADLNEVWCVGLDANGRVVKGGGNSSVLGVLVLTKQRFAGEIVDVMTSGEIVEMNVGHAGIVAGTPYYANEATGALEAAAPAAGVSGVKIGTTVEATRLVVRVDQVQGVPA
jgi:hypothetical protein